MMNVDRLEHAAHSLRAMASNPADHDANRLLALADELDQFRKEIPPFMDFTLNVLAKYTLGPRT
ncbi:hypothetical protein ACWV16_08290 [Achromobacter xylosoxidans]